jgi:putative restriction endonuclease
MGAYVAPTDFQWFQFLANIPNIDEVNFWRPRPWGGNFGVLRRGEPLLFKLKAPHNMIAGGGYFEYYSDLPLSVAWESFGVKNGAPSLAHVHERIAPLRQDNPALREDYVIGCTLLVEPFFWPRELWIPEPEDWRANIVRGKRYEFDSRVGRKLWEQVAERVQSKNLGRAVAERQRLTVPGGYGDPMLRPRRIGQGTFRVLVIDAYDRRCAVTGARALPALDAVHIRPFSDTAAHDVRNGLLLRSDIHRLFDAGYLTVSPEYKVVLSSRLSHDFSSDASYAHLHGARIHLPPDAASWPDAEALRWHNANRFKE